MIEKINSLKIEHFRGLRDIPELEFNSVNFFVSPGNYGKTSILQAIVTAMNYDEGSRILYTGNLFKKTKCKDYDMLSQLLCKNNVLYGYSLTAVFNDYTVKKELKGAFVENNKRFVGEYCACLSSITQNATNEMRNSVDFSRDGTEKYSDSGIFSPKIAYFDFEVGCECQLTELKNSNFKNYILAYLKRFDFKIDDVYIRNRKYMIHHSSLGDVVADNFGSVFRRCMEFINFCDKNKPEVLIIENADCLCCEESYEFFAETFIATLFEMNCQVFVTARSRSFMQKNLERAEKCNSRRYVNFFELYKNEEKTEIVKG